MEKQKALIENKANLVVGYMKLTFQFFFTSIKLTGFGLDLVPQCFSFEMDLGLEGSNIGLGLGGSVVATTLLFSIHSLQKAPQCKDRCYHAGLWLVSLSSSSYNIKIHSCVGVWC